MINIDIKGIDKLLKELDPSVAKKAINRTLNDIAKKTRTGVSREITDHHNVSAKRVKEDLKTVSGTRRATTSRPRSIVEIQSLRKWPGLQHYKARALKKGGVSYAIYKGKPRERLPKGFMLNLPNGTTAVFTRATNNIIRKTGPSVAQMSKGYTTKVADRVTTEELNNNFMTNYNFYASKAIF